MIDINFIKKILLKNFTFIVFLSATLFAIILTAYVTRHFDKKEYDEKIKLCEKSLQKEKDAKKYMEQELQKTQVDDIYVNIEIIKSKQNEKEETIKKKEQKEDLNNNTQKNSNNNENVNINENTNKQ